MHQADTLDTQIKFACARYQFLSQRALLSTHPHQGGVCFEIWSNTQRGVRDEKEGEPRERERERESPFPGSGGGFVISWRARLPRWRTDWVPNYSLIDTQNIDNNYVSRCTNRRLVDAVKFNWISLGSSCAANCIAGVLISHSCFVLHPICKTKSLLNTTVFLYMNNYLSTRLIM